MRIIGLDIHRTFAEAVAWDDDKLKLTKEDVVVIEATGSASSVAAVIAPHVKKVVIANQSKCASSPMRRSRPMRSTPASSLNFMQAAFCRKSGFRTSRRRRFAGK
jgi:hypothetical protein